MIHHSQSVDFRVTEWPSASGSENFYFNSRTVDYGTGVLLQYILEALYAAHRPFVVAPVFSLVNITCSQTKYSYGKIPTCPQKVRKGSLSFTFALISEQEYSQMFTTVIPEPRTTVNGGRNVTFWGLDVIHSNDFLTINVDAGVLSKAHISSPMLNGLRYLYNVIGGATKNFVRREGFFKPKTAHTPPRLDELTSLRDHIFDLPIPTLMRRASIDQWVYNESVWTKASNLIHPYMLNDMVWAYFAMFIMPKLPFKLHKDLERVVDTEMLRITEDGLVDLMTALRTSAHVTVSETTPAMVVAASLLRTLLSGKEDRDTDIIKVTVSYVNDLTDYLFNTQRDTVFFDVVSDLKQTAKQLLQQDQRLHRRLHEEVKL